MRQSLATRVRLDVSVVVVVVVVVVLIGSKHGKRHNCQHVWSAGLDFVVWSQTILAWPS
jgi:hypothetical protein